MCTSIKIDGVHDIHIELSKGILFMQDNAPAHKVYVTIQKVRDLSFELGELPPCLPDLATSHYEVFHG